MAKARSKKRSTETKHKLRGPALLRHLESELQRREHELKTARLDLEDARTELTATKQDALDFAAYCERRVTFHHTRCQVAARALNMNADKLKRATEMAALFFEPEPIGLVDDYPPLLTFAQYTQQRSEHRADAAIKGTFVNQAAGAVTGRWSSKDQDS